jgi:hypothetical protein
MGSWAQWTAKTALLAAGFAAAAGGLSSVALAAGGLSGVVGAACQVGNAVVPPAAPGQTGPGTANTPPAGSGQSPASPCGSAAAVLGDSTAGCVSGALAGVTQSRPATGTRSGGIAADVIQRTVAPVTSVLGVTAAAPRGLTGERVRRTFGNVPGASGAGETNVPAPSQLAGLGALPGLADLPSLANMPAPNGVTRGGIPMPGTALSAASTSGMSSDSFAALAVGALLAGASALKIARRRAPRTSRLRTGRAGQRHTRRVFLVVTVQAQNVRTGRMIRLRRVAFLLPSALSESLDSSQSPYSAWSVRILRAASRASRDIPRGRYTTR